MKNSFNYRGMPPEDVADDEKKQEMFLEGLNEDCSISW
jgi:hypothetical protein